MDYPKFTKKTILLESLYPINTALHPLVTYLHKLISNSLPKAASHVNNSFELYNLLSGKKIEDSHKLISLDVTSLFTNVPLDLAIEDIDKRWSLTEKNTNIQKEDFISSIRFILSSTYFTFNNIIYKQTFGTPTVISGYCRYRHAGSGGAVTSYCKI